MSKEKYIFSLKMSRGLSLFFGVLGLAALLAGLDMGFFNEVIPAATGTDDGGYRFAVWFLLVIGSLVLFSGIRNLLSPFTILAVNRKGIGIKANPGLGKTLSFIPWEDIKLIEEGEIMVQSTPRSISHRSIRLVLKEEAATQKDKITDATIHWHKGYIDIDSGYFREKLDKVIEALNVIKNDPYRFLEVDSSFNDTVKQYQI